MGLCRMVAPGVYALHDDQAVILAHEIESLAGFIEWRGGQALAMGAWAEIERTRGRCTLFFRAFRLY